MNVTSLAQKAAVTITLSIMSTRRAFAQAIDFPELGGDLGEGDTLFDLLQELATDGLQVILLLVGVVAFIIVGWSVISKFNECRAGRAEWSEAGVTAGIGAVVLVFATFLLTQADSLFNTDET